MKKLLSSLLAACISLSLALPAAALDVEDAKALLQTYYVNGVPPEVMELDSLDEILEALGDPYTDYFTAEEYQDFLTFVNGETVVGIGVSISKEFHDGYELLSVLPGSPALEAGLKAGDVLTAVDGVPLTADPPPADLIQGEAGTKLTLTVRRKENGQLWNLSLKRREVTLPTVHYALEDGAAIIVCGSFGSTAADMMAQAILEMEPQSSVYLVDLRANPGGTSQSATTSSGLFIGSGIMAYFRHANGRYHYLDLPPNTPDLTDKPLVVLTSPHSASAAELFAAAVRDYNAGIAIGQRTYGKGIAQHVYDETTHPDLFDGDCLKITVYRFFSPKGTTNDTVGVIPTLLLSPENTPEAALLLSAPQPEQPDGSLKLELDGQTFYIELAKALEEANSAALTELLRPFPLRPAVPGRGERLDRGNTRNAGRRTRSPLCSPHLL